MIKRYVYIVLLACFAGTQAGCIDPFSIGLAAGGVSAYAASRDTIQGEADKSYEAVWDAAVKVSKIRGTVAKQDARSGKIDLETDSGKVWITVIRMSRTTTRLRVAARRYKLPNITLANDIFLKIMEAAQE
ncbi:MAG: hypothetical protein WCY10_06155 [Candidatus Omnitrophota bacterium]